jgi:branched-chain amino acid transport system permease protein
VSELPKVIPIPLQQPLFILGVLFILVVFVVPGGLTRIGQVGVRLDRILRKPAVQEEAS